MTRRRVSDTINNKDSQDHQSEKVRSLLASLQRAQNKDVGLSTEKSVEEPKKRREVPSSSNRSSESTTYSNNSNNKKGESRSDGGSVGARMSRQKKFDQVLDKKQNSQPTVLKFVNKNYAQQQQKVASKSTSAKGAQRIPKDVLDDLHFRFLANIPDHEKNDAIRVCFQIELAQWLYIDFYCAQEERTDCPQHGMKEFARQIFLHCPEFKHLAPNLDKVIDQWRQYKSNVPTYGAILLDKSLDYVLLVQGYYASKNSWGFPKGKVNENEDPRICAIREVYEETGFDFSEVANGKETKLQKFINDTMVRLYIVPDVPMEFPFSPMTRKEIRQIQWFNLWDLPTDRYDQNRLVSNNNFYTVMPFVQDLQNFVRKEKTRRAKASSRGKWVEPDMKYLNENTPGSQSIPSSFTQSEQQFSSVSLNALFNNLLPATKTDFKKSEPSNTSTSTSNVSTGFSPMVSQNTHFRPLFPNYQHEGNTLLDFLQTGNLNPAAPTSSTAPRIAYPIPVQATPSDPPTNIINKPVYVAPKESSPKLAKISPSATSAFTAIAPSKPSGLSLTEMGEELAKLLCVPSSPSSTDSTKDKENIENIKTGFNELTDMRSNFSSTMELSQIPVEGRVEPCQAWKSFKLNVSHIFSPVPSSTYSSSHLISR